MKLLKSLIKFLLLLINGIAGLFGIKLFVYRFNSVHKPVIYDQYLWEPYYKEFDEIKLYQKAQAASFSEKYDNPYKQLRFYSLQNVFQNTLKNNIKGDIAECGVWKGHSAYILSTLLKASKRFKRVCTNAAKAPTIIDNPLAKIKTVCHVSIKS